MQDREVDGRGVDRADEALVPVGDGSVVVGLAQESIEYFFAISLPSFAGFAIFHLRVVVVGIVPVAEALVRDVGQIIFAIFQQLGHIFAVVVAGIEQTGHGGGRNRGVRAATLGTILHAAVGHRAFANIFDRLVDHFLRHDDPRVAAATQTLHLGDRGRAFVEFAAALR